MQGLFPLNLAFKLIFIISIIEFSVTYVAWYCTNLTERILMLKQKFQTGFSPPSPTTEGTIFNLTCQTGYEWIDGSLIKQILCNKSWETQLSPACSRVYMYFDLDIKMKIISLMSRNTT